MAYCTIAEVKSETGSSLGTIVDADITEMIGKSDKEIASKLRKKGLTAPSGSNDDLNIASTQFTIAKIKRRQSHELSRPGSLNLGDISFSAQPETEAQEAEKKAEDAILAYIASVNGAGPRAAKVRTARCR